MPRDDWGEARPAGAGALGVIVESVPKRTLIGDEELGARVAMNAPQPELLITLVHGTWGRGMFPQLRTKMMHSKPAWFEDGSDFRKRLTAALGTNVLFREFHWSGCNSIMARENAASTLANDLDRSRIEYPLLRYAVIGHSHGGTVALSALRRTSAISGTWLFVSLATPFMHFDIENTQTPIIAKIHALFRSSTVILFITYIALFLNSMFHLFPAIHELFPYQYPFLLLSYVVFLLSMFVIVFGAISISPPSTTTDVPSPISCLILRSFDDDVAHVLFASVIARRLFSFVFSFFFEGVFIFAGLNLFLFAHVVLFWLTGTDIEVINMMTTATRESLQYDMMVTIPVTTFVLQSNVIVAIVSMSFIAVARMANGWEMAFCGLQTQINVHTSPDVIGNVEIQSLPSSAQNPAISRHSIYEHTECAERIAKWLLSHCQNHVHN